MEELLNYFPELTLDQRIKFQHLVNLYLDWNSKINVISRKDMAFFYERHVLHSIGIAKVLSFLPKSKVLDVGTGGGFPGIPLAILFPETHFYLIDSIGKKIKVVEEVKQALKLNNVTAIQQRAADFPHQVDFVVSRAVTRMEIFVPWVKRKVLKQCNHSIKNGILYLKGGDLSDELAAFPKAEVIPLNRYFSSSFFQTKALVYLPL